MSIRVIEGHDIEGDVVVSTDHMYLGHAKEFALEYKCNVMVKSWKGWEFKRVEIKDRKTPEGLIKWDGAGTYKSVYIL